MTNEEQVFQAAAERFTDKPVSFTIAYKSLTLWQRIKIRLKLIPAALTFTIKPITVGNFERIAPVINRIPDDIFTHDVERTIMANGLAHLNDFLYIIAVGITNKKKEPSKALMQLLKEEMTWPDIQEGLRIIMHFMGTYSFIKSTVLIKGTQILTGPTTAEIIAPETHGPA